MDPENVAGADEKTRKAIQQVHNRRERFLKNKAEQKRQRQVQQARETYNLESRTKLFNYRLLEEVKGANSRVTERVYRFGFNTPLGIAMIHNAIYGGTWDINPSLYQVSGDAQLLYRYLVITGARRKNNRVEFIGHRIGWREKNVKRLTASVESLFSELFNAGLIVKFEKPTGSRGSRLFHYETKKEPRSGKKRKRRRK